MCVTCPKGLVTTKWQDKDIEQLASNSIYSRFVCVLSGWNSSAKVKIGFVGAEGDIAFYKNAPGSAAVRP